MTNSKFYRVLSLVLAFVMTVSLFSNWTMPVFAETGIKTEPIAPVITTAFKDDEVELYAAVEDDALSTKVTGVAGKTIQLYNKVTNESTGEVFYQFRLSGLSTSDLGTVVDEYSFVAADEVVYQEKNSKSEEPAELMYREMTDEGTGVQVNATVPRGATLEVSKYSVPQAGVENGLIWGRTDSVFYNVKIMYDGQEYQPENGAVVVFPSTAIPFAEGKTYTTYFYDKDGELNSLSIRDPYDVKEGIYVPVSYVDVVGVAVEFTADNKNVTYESLEETLTAKFVNNTVKLYADTTLLEYKEFTVAENDIVLISEKSTVVYDNGNTVELYLIDVNGYSGDNSEMEEAITPSDDGLPYFYVLCSEVEEYVGPTPEIPTVDQTITDSETGIIISGKLPEGVSLEINEIPANEVSLIVDTNLFPMGLNVKAYDIKLWLDGEEYDPNGYFTIKIKKDNLEIDGRTGLVVYHNHEEQTDIIGPVVYGGNNFNLSVEDDGKFIFTDLFKEGGFEEIEGKFNKETVTLYCDLFPNSPTFTVENATTYAVTSSMYFVDKYDVKWRMLNEDFVDANGEYYVWVKDEYITECELLPKQQLVDEKTGIKVEGRLPENVMLNVTPLERGDIDFDEDKYPLNGDMFLYDITLTVDGKEYQPEDSASIIFPQEMCNFENGLFYVVYHVHNDGTVDVLGPYGYITGDIKITVDSFSSFGFSEDYTFEDIELFSAVFTGTTVKLYKEHLSVEDYVEVSVTDKDMVYPYMKITLDDGTVKYALDYYTVTEGDANYNSALAVALNGNPPYNIVFAEDIEEYIPVVEQDVVDPTTGITVSGALPQGTGVIVTEKEISADWDTSRYPLGKTTKVFDISLTFRGEEYQPEGYVNINIPKDTLAMGADKGLAIYHVHNDQTDVIGPVVYGGKDFNLSVDSFSDFVFTDAFGTGSAKGWRGFLNKAEVEVFENIFPDSPSFVMTDTYDYEVKGETYYIAEDGSMWLMLNNGISDGKGKTYFFVKSEDVRLTYLDDVCLVMPTVGFTQVAQPMLSSFNSATQSRMAFSFDSRLMSASSSDVLASAEDKGTLSNGLFISKNVYGNETDGYKIKLESYVTGNVTVTRTSIPTDIVLVLDQSGSMDSKMGSYNYTSISGKKAYSYYNTSSPVYYKVDNEYYPVTITRTTDDSEYIELTGNNRAIRDASGTKYALDEYGVYCVLNVSKTRNGNTYTYSYNDSKGDTQTATSQNDTGTPPIKVYQENSNATYTYTYSYIDGEGVLHSQQFVGTTTNLTTGYYTASFNSDQGEVRLTALKKAVQTFVESVATDAKGEDKAYGTADDINHRIAVVGFANPDFYDDYNNTEIFVGASEYTYNAGEENSATDANAAQKHYGDAMQSMNTQAGHNTVRATVGYDSNGDGDWGDSGDIKGVLDGDGATYLDLGLELANGILEAEKNYKASTTETQRNKVVIVFTDGIPGYYGKWGSAGYYDAGNNAAEVADAVINQARITKNTYGATVYSIGIFAGADAGRFTINSDNTVTLGYRPYQATDNSYAYDNSNRYMHYMSSNFTPEKTATSASMTEFGDETFPRKSGVPNGDSYYLSASNAEDLNSIFQKLSENINGTSNSELSSSAVVRDIISPYFTLPKNADVSCIRISTWDALYTGETLSWDNEQQITSTASNVKIDGKTIDVSGFNFKENYVASTARKETTDSAAADFYGRKLVIEIPIIVNPDFLGGLNVPTNDEKSGVYESATAESAVREFVIPEVDISLKNIQPVLQDQHIYVSNPADLDKMLAGTDTDARYEFKIVNVDGTTSDTYEFDGINNEYVNVTYTVKDGDTIVKTLTIPANADSGTWTGLSSLINDLTEDKTYTITCQLTEKIDPSVKSEEKSDTGKVYVYTPTVTFADSTYYYGIATPDPASNLTNTVWSNKSQGTANTTLMGVAPIINYVYTPSETVEKHVTGKLTPDGDDITFTVAAKANSMNLVDKQVIKFVHTTDTNLGTGCTFNPANGQFMWHIVKPTVKFADKGVHYGATLEKASDETAYGNVTTQWLYKGKETKATITGEQPTITFTYGNTLVANGGTVAATGDIEVPVTVNINGTAAPTANVIESSSCGIITGDSMAGGFKLHVYTPTVKFDDTGLYYDGTTTVSDFSKNLVSATWLCGTLTEKEMLTKQPSLSYTYNPTSVAPTTEDVYVKVTVKANETTLVKDTSVKFTHDDCIGEIFDATKGEFIVHIFTPVIPFKDTIAYYGDLANITGSFCRDEITWKHSNISSESVTMTGTKPTSFGFDIVWPDNTLVSQGDGYIVNTTEDIPFDVTEVTIGSSTVNIIDKVEFTHKDCVEGEQVPDYSASNKAEFVIHVETVELDVSKTVKDPQGNDFNDKQDYTFTVEFAGKINLTKIKKALNGATATDYTVKGNKITFTLQHGDVVKFTELPVGLFKVTETDPGEAYETTVNDKKGLSTSVTLSKDTTTGTVAFVNTLTIADLIITKNVPAASYNAEDTFVFNVDSGSDNTTDLTVIINSSTMTPNDEGMYTASVKVKGINVGTRVTVTEDTSWSWRYKVTADGDAVADGVATTTIAANGGSVTFTNTIDKTQWLSSEAYAENSFSEYNAGTPIITSSGIKFAVNETN